jgi:hypothetical protein
MDNKTIRELLLKVERDPGQFHQHQINRIFAMALGALVPIEVTPAEDAPLKQVMISAEARSKPSDPTLNSGFFPNGR